MTPLQMNLRTIGGCTFNPYAIAAIDWLNFPLFFTVMGLAMPDDTKVLSINDDFTPAVTLMFVGGGDFEFAGESAQHFLTWYMQATGRETIKQPKGAEVFQFGGKQ
jgi:hypothetical protein